MDDLIAEARQQLYDADFYAWTQEQAALLRVGHLAQADVANILEEIETLGREEVSELRSRLKVLALHLLKEIAQPERAGRSWAATIVNQRQEIARHIRDNPSLRPKTSAIFLEAYVDARALAAVETGLAIKVFPTLPLFTPDQALDDAYWPGRPFQHRGERRETPQG